MRLWVLKTLDYSLLIKVKLSSEIVKILILGPGSLINTVYNVLLIELHLRKKRSWQVGFKWSVIFLTGGIQYILNLHFAQLTSLHHKCEYLQRYFLCMFLFWRQTTWRNQWPHAQRTPVWNYRWIGNAFPRVRPEKCMLANILIQLHV